MFIVLYRWTLRPDKEEQFISAWTEITEYFRRNWDSLGSRLHRGDDGTFYAYAQWKSLADREKAFAGAAHSDAGARMAEAVAERFEPVILETLADFLILPEK